MAALPLRLLLAAAQPPAAPLSALLPSVNVQHPLASGVRVQSMALPYQTALSPAREQQFLGWVQRNKVPFDPRAGAAKGNDYDMRGFYQALMNNDPRATTAVNAFDGKLHFPDTWKTPLHRTFSNQSIYATPNAPRWVGNKLIAPGGRVIADETPKKKVG